MYDNHELTALLINCKRCNRRICNIQRKAFCMKCSEMTERSSEAGNKLLQCGVDAQIVATAVNEASKMLPGKIRPKKNPEDEYDIIGELMGNYGKWQFIMTILLSLFQVPNTFHITSTIYQAAEKEFWCKRPEHLNQLNISTWRNFTNSTDNCYINEFNWNQLTVDDIERNSTQQRMISRIRCTEWEYATNDGLGNTWISEWDLVCEKDYLKNVAEMFFLVGVASGGVISGYLSDQFGRKTMLFISVVLQTIVGLALYFVRSFEFYLALRTILGVVSVSATYSALILAIEYVDGKWRTIAGMYNLFPLPICYMIISGIAYLAHDFRLLQLIIGLPGILLCFLWFVCPESPRWLLVKGRVAEVKTIIKSAAAFNGRELPDNMDKLLKPPPYEVNDQGCLKLFHSKYLRLVTICFLIIWFSMNLVYYGLVLNMGAFGGNIYLTSALAGLVELPAMAIAIYMIRKVGKKWFFCATFFAAGVACLCAAATEGITDLLWLKIVFLMIGKFTISAGNIIMPVYTAELYPTKIRNAGVGACNFPAGLALILTPYLSILNKVEEHLLMLCLTAWCIVGGFVIIFLPETIQHETEEEREERC